MKPRWVIGIDSSMTRTAVCRAVDGVEVMTTSFPTGPGLARPARLAAIRDQVRSFVARGLPAEAVLLVAMESEIYGPGIHTDAAAVQAVIQLALWELFQERGTKPLDPVSRFLSVNPAHVKKWLGAKEKNEILLKVYKVYGREFRIHDEADAYAIAMIGSAFLAYEAGSAWPEATKPQLEVLEKLRKLGLVWERPPETPKRRKEKR